MQTKHARKHTAHLHDVARYPAKRIRSRIPKQSPVISMHLAPFSVSRLDNYRDRALRPPATTDKDRTLPAGLILVSTQGLLACHLLHLIRCDVVRLARVQLITAFSLPARKLKFRFGPCSVAAPILEPVNALETI